MSFAETFLQRRQTLGGLCIGIDPSSEDLERWRLPPTPESLRRFSSAILEAAAGLVAVVKPQVAYFERFGPEGFAVLRDLVREARARGLLVIADAKRGDIGPTMGAYGEAWLGPASPFAVDAITANAYLGLAALEPLLQRAAAIGGTVFVVLRSSNPEGTGLQTHGDPPLWHRLLQEMAAWARNHDPATLGAVVGATVRADLALTLDRLPHALILAPGIGAQGATLAELAGLGPRVLASTSRSIAARGPDIASLKQAIRDAKAA